jgi:hypothetical protein
MVKQGESLRFVDENQVLADLAIGVLRSLPPRQVRRVMEEARRRLESDSHDKVS